MGSLFFEDGSREKLVKKAISAPTLQAFLEFYAGRLLDSRAVDSKEACMEQVGRLISDSMDRGECSIATMEHMKSFIQKYSIPTEGSKKRSEFSSLFEQICQALSKCPSKDLSPELVAKFEQYKAACDSKKRLEAEFSAELRKPIKQILGSYMSGHKSNVSNIDFGMNS